MMPALDRERSGSNKRRSNGRAGGGGTGNGRGGAGSAAAGASSGEGADRSTRTDALAPSPSPESDAKKKTRMIEEDDDDDDALSWQLPGPRKYSRLNSPSAGDVVPGARSFDPDDDGAIGEEEEGEDDDDEAESGPESASSRRLVLRREASRSKAEEEATDAAMALGKVSLGVVPEEDTAAASAGDRTRREGATDAEPSDGKKPRRRVGQIRSRRGTRGGRGRRPGGESNPRPLRSRRRRTRRRRRRGGNRREETREATGRVRVRPRRRSRVIFPSRAARPVTPSGTCWRRTARWRTCRCGRTGRPGGWSTPTRRARTPRSRRCTRRRFSASSCGCRDFRRTWSGRKQPPRAGGRIRGRNGRGGREGLEAGDETSVRRITRTRTHTHTLIDDATRVTLLPRSSPQSR